MEYRVYKLAFETGIHIGNGKLSDAESSVCADTMFSAMCHEALAMGGESELNRLAAYARDGLLAISDGLPYIGDTLYIPKPMWRIESDNEQGSSELKKQYKRLAYVPMDKLDSFFDGSMDVRMENERLKELGAVQLFSKAAVYADRDCDLYSVGAYKFKSGNGLYFIVGTDSSKIQEYVGDILLNMEMSGIGGKRSSGLGRFYINDFELKNTAALTDSYSAYMTLSACMARESELNSILPDAVYSLKKRSGYVVSDTYTNDNNAVKKRDFYSFKCGSVFRERFEGDVFDVSDNGNHAVYRYAKPMLLGVNV